MPVLVAELRINDVFDDNCSAFDLACILRRDYQCSEFSQVFFYRLLFHQLMVLQKPVNWHENTCPKANVIASEAQ